VPRARGNHCQRAPLATPLLIANGDHERSGEDAHELVCVMAMEPTALVRADALANYHQLARPIRGARDHTLGSIGRKLVHERHGPMMPGAYRYCGSGPLTKRRFESGMLSDLVPDQA
jgi:hypothetical protein